MSDFLGDGSQSLSKAEVLRYSRHLILPEIGLAGQERLRGARVLLVGAGGLGSPAALYLAAAGVGRIGLVDADRVDVSNLQRQVLYATGDVDRPKVEAAAERLSALNPHVQIVSHDTRMDAYNAMELVAGYDIVVDGSDNFATRYLVNDACVLAGVPNVHASVFRFEGQLSVFGVPGSPCYRCLYPEAPPPELAPSCAEAGVLGVLPGLMGVLQALETIKLITGAGEPTIGRLIRVDALSLSMRSLRIVKDRECDICGDTPTRTDLYEHQAGGAETGSSRIAQDDVPTMTALELKKALDENRSIIIVDVRAAHEFAIVHIEGAELLPLHEIEAGAEPPWGGDTILLYCKSGARSARAAKTLIDRGMTNVASLEGGVEAWTRDVDPSGMQY